MGRNPEPFFWHHLSSPPAEEESFNREARSEERVMEEEDDDIRAVLEEAFGESSSSSSEDDDEDEIQIGVDPNDEDRILVESPNWERVGEINGLWICREFLSPDQQSSLLSAIHRGVSPFPYTSGEVELLCISEILIVGAEGWFTEASCNQAMRFGDLPQWAMELAYLIREVVHIEADKEACILPSNILWRVPIFDQLIVNVYQPGEGICAHVDLMRFDDGIAIISLESSCVMHFTRVKRGLENIGNVQDSDPPQISKVPVYLAKGSLVIMWGEARYQWMHEINRKPGFQKWEEKDIDQSRRTSITFRKLCQND